MAVDSDLAAGQLEQIRAELEEVRRLLERQDDAGELVTARWDPAEPAGGARAVWDYPHRGRYAGVAIFNTSTVAIRVSFTPAGASAARGGDFTLSARGFVTLPYAGSTVSVSGDTAGSALVVLLAFAPPPNAGTF